VKKTIQCCLFMSLLLSAGPLAFAQGAGIGTTNPDPSAALHILEENNKGVLIPRRGVIPGAADGMIVYNTATGNLAYSSSGVWTEIVPVPSGTVIMWSYSQGGIPDGWVLCDGNYYSLQGGVVGAGSGIRTPDLRGYFIAGYSGAGSYGAVGAIGGSKYHSLSEAEMPAHTHSVSDPGHNHTISVTASPHTHDFTVEDTAKDNIGVFPNSGAATFPGIYYNLSAGAKVTGNVITGVTVNNGTTGISVNAAGSGQGHENRPPYYVLAFIMKL
jgi:microcystin-dependent protein